MPDDGPLEPPDGWGAPPPLPPLPPLEEPPPLPGWDQPPPLPTWEQQPPPLSDPTQPLPGWAPPSGYGPPPQGPGYGYGYGNDAYGYGPAYGAGPIAHPRGTTVMVLGGLSLASFLCCPFWICGVLAWVLGNQALKEIDAQPGRYTNRSSVATGRNLGIAGTCIAIGMVVLWGGVQLALALAG